jgi:hypothetical protein
VMKKGHADAANIYEAEGTPTWLLQPINDCNQLSYFEADLRSAPRYALAYHASTVKESAQAY